ncbi:MAG: MATE family efflux transporter [Alphaproteobacteria bacterium]|nr:MATE family efflux transporter [Alphaproteobacteria bacterium]
MLNTMTTLFDTSEAARASRREMLKPWIEEARQLLWLAAPLIAMHLAQIGSITADIIMVGPLGKESLAATGIGAVLFYLAWLIGYGPVAAVSPIIAQILGAHPNDRARTRAAVRMGLWAVGALAVPLMVVLVWAKPVLLMLGQDPKVVALAAGWVHAVALGLPFSLGFGVLRGFATAIGRQHFVLFVSIAVVLINIALNYALIYGHFGAPALGVLGAGISSACAYAFAFFTMLSVATLTPAFKKYHVLHRFNRPDWAKFAEVFRLGVPMGISMIFEAMLFNSATLLMGTFGAASVAAHQIALNVGSVTFMVPLGIGIAATVRVGLAAGAGNHEAVRRAGHTAIAFGAGFMLLCAVAIALMPHTLAGLYIATNDPSNADVVRLVVPFLYVAAVFQVFDAMQVTGQMSLRGLKDAQAPAWIAGLSYWLVGFTTCVILGFVFDLKGLGIWIGLATGLAAAAAGMVLRFEILSRRNLR